jgi:hypothetical protein
MMLVMVSSVLAPTIGWQGAETVRAALAASGGAVPTGDSSPAASQPLTDRPPASGLGASQIACTLEDQDAGGGAAGTASGSETVQRCTGSPTILITLRWNNSNDEDLHVVEPNGTEIWYSSPGPTETGGVLDNDDKVAVCGDDADPGDAVENVTWAAWTNPDPGTYRVRIEEYQACSETGPAPADWTAQVYVDGRQIDSRSGTTPGTTAGDTVAEFSFEYTPTEPDEVTHDVAPNDNGAD